MRKVVLGFSVVALALSLAACGGTDQQENNIAAEDLNAMTNLEELPPVAPAANVAVEETVTESRQPTTTKPAPAKPAPAKPKPEPAAEPKAPDPTCLPEHRAAGHC